MEGILQNHKCRAILQNLEEKDLGNKCLKRKLASSTKKFDKLLSSGKSHFFLKFKYTASPSMCEILIVLKNTFTSSTCLF